jgi:hypothetical protein
MAMDEKATELKDQRHPQYSGDRAIVNQLLNREPDDYGLAELGRLLTRYKGFPGARDIQVDLERVLKKWGLTEATLFDQTRAIHQQAEVYDQITSKRDDWS